jgi:hypothetical protein
MSRLRIQLLVATGLVATASFAGASAALASVGGEGYGTGTTALNAEHAADRALHGDYYGCNTPTLVYDTQNPDGTWSAEVAAVCEGYN